MAKKKGEKPGVLLYWDTLDTLEKARGENLRLLLRAIRNFAQYGEVPDFSDNEALDMAWPGIQSKLEYDDESFERKRTQRVNAANKRWEKERAKANSEYERIQPNADGCERIRNMPNTDTNTDTNTNTEDIADKPQRTRFLAPTVEEVQEYCKERNNSVDPQRFIDYYTANGWMVGKNKMRDWKAAVRTWENNSNSNNRTGANHGRDQELNEWSNILGDKVITL